MELVVSKKSISYEDRSTISHEDFDRYLPLDSVNSNVTYNHWNGLFVYKNKIYVLSNHTTNDKSVTKALGMILSVYDTRPVWDVDGDGELGRGDVTAMLDILEKPDGNRDVNGDGHTSNADAVTLIKLMAGF